jgi:hypothetical protein
VGLAADVNSGEFVVRNNAVMRREFTTLLDDGLPLTGQNCLASFGDQTTFYSLVDPAVIFLLPRRFN